MSGGPFERSALEVGLQLARAGALAPLSAASLVHQWRTSAAVKRRDVAGAVGLGGASMMVVSFVARRQPSGRAQRRDSDDDEPFEERPGARVVNVTSNETDESAEKCGERDV